jgi:hypothetical protein
MTPKEARKSRDSNPLKRHSRADQFTVTRDAAIVATGTRDEVWDFVATHDGDFAVRSAA